MTARIAPLALALALLAGAAPASAAEVSLRVAPAAGVRLGSPTEISGRVTEAGSPVARRVVVLELRRYPYRGRWRERAAARTGADGRFAFSRRLDRNHRVRVRLEPEGADPQYLPDPPATLSPRRDAYVLPAFTLRYRQRSGRVIRIVQTYTVPRGVRLSAPTRFYVGACEPDRRGRCTARRAPLRATAETRRVRAGRYRARATVRIPAAFDGRFRYVSCFGYSKGSGMGDPDLRCPRRSIRLR